MIQGSTITSHRHWRLKEKTILLRKRGFSYKEILDKIPVAKSTVSLWCRDVPLTAAQRRRLEAKHGNRIKGIQAIQTMFWRKRCEYFEEGARAITELNKKDRFIAGLMLYWAEGTKGSSLALTNSDPRIIKFMTEWLKEFCGIAPEAMVMHMHLHSGQNEQLMKQYWSELTGIPKTNFLKSFVKSEGSGYRKKVLYNGTVKLRVRGKGSTYLLFQTLGSIAAFIYNAIGEKPIPENWMSKLPHAKKWVGSSAGRAARS